MKIGAHQQARHSGGGRALARIDIGPFGPAVASLYRANDGIPRFSVGKQDVPLLDRAEQENLPVFVKALVRTIPNCSTSNVTGTLPGASTDEILYIAHADTKYNSPGASDNTASMIAMLMLAHELTGEPWIEEWFDRVYEWSMARFPMPEVGEWRQRLNRKGEPITEVIALPVKDPFHLPRALILAVQLLEGRQAGM